MITLLEVFHWSQLLQPQFYIEHGGLWLLLFVVFAETGLFFGFFLPGDSLLFVAGIYSAPLVSQIFVTDSEWLNLGILFAFISVAGILGNYVGYFIGKKVGPAMYEWKDNLLFKKNDKIVINKLAKKVDKNYKELSKPIVVGATVKMKNNYQVGEVLDIKGKRAIVKIGQLPMNIDLVDLVVVEKIITNP
jgi:hypothetical protein